MRKRKLFHLLLSLFVFLTSSNYSFAQLDKSFLFLNYKKSFKSNFLNTEFQIGNSEEMDFLTIHIGYNFSKYNSDKFVPYHLGTTELDSNYRFSNYESSKKGFQIGLGYAHYFKSSENIKEFIPFLSIESYWLHHRDNYILSYSQPSNQKAELKKIANFNTISFETQFGVLYALNKIFFRASASFAFYLPINTSIYMATDKYNAYSGFELPLAGIEPLLQMSVGMKLF